MPTQQMVALYKDPKGEKVFDKYETPSFKSQQQTARKQEPAESTTGTIDSLRKRIQELETLLAVNQSQVGVLFVQTIVLFIAEAVENSNSHISIKLASK